jgi:hypothetical protein
LRIGEGKLIAAVNRAARADFDPGGSRPALLLCLQIA